MKKTFAYFGLILFSLSIIFVTGETVVRVADLPPRRLNAIVKPGEEEPYVRLSKNKILGYEYRPGFEGIPGYEGDHKGFKINTNGFRDRVYPVAKAPNTKRILVLGDSITVGSGIPNPEHTYAKRLEKILNAMQEKTEVMNLGVGGYETYQEVELLQSKGLKYKPDVVVIGFCLNDFWIGVDGGAIDKLEYQQTLDEKAHGEHLLFKGNSLTALGYKHSRFLFFGYHHLFSLKERILGRKRKYTYEKPVAEGLARLKALSQEYGFETHLFIIPSFSSPFDSYKSSALHKRLYTEAASFPDLRIYDLIEKFRQDGSLAQNLTYDGLHPNEKGHLKIAHYMAEILQKKSQYLN